LELTVVPFPSSLPLPPSLFSSHAASCELPLYPSCLLSLAHPATDSLLLLLRFPLDEWLLLARRRSAPIFQPSTLFLDSLSISKTSSSPRFASLEATKASSLRSSAACSVGRVKVKAHALPLPFLPVAVPRLDSGPFKRPRPHPGPHLSPTPLSLRQQWKIYTCTAPHHPIFPSPIASPPSSTSPLNPLSRSLQEQEEEDGQVDLGDGGDSDPDMDEGGGEGSEAEVMVD